MFLKKLVHKKLYISIDIIVAYFDIVKPHSGHFQCIITYFENFIAYFSSPNNNTCTRDI